MVITKESVVNVLNAISGQVLSFCSNPSEPACSFIASLIESDVAVLSPFTPAFFFCADQGFVHLCKSRSRKMQAMDTVIEKTSTKGRQCD